ncbi:MAG: WG repeat-containing protein [Bacteroidales bacterium]|nr:WG repeat-containing protein [Bacteroidales bacterium]
MQKVGTIGEFILIEDGFWCGTIDKNGRMRISPDLHYRSIYEFVDGVAIACQSIQKNEALKWGLIDADGNHVSEFKYGFVEAWGEGYYKCEIGNKKNILRKDGSEVLKNWFNDVYKVERGLFVISNTIRKTKEHPTLYLRGLASVNGDVLFPPIFDRLGWHDEITLDFFYAEKNGKPYIITKEGSIIDPAGDHLPKSSDEEDNFIWNGPKDTVCDGCIFTDGINNKGEGCRKLQKQDFRNNVIKGRCEYCKQNEQDVSCREKWDMDHDEQAKDKASKVSDVYATKLVKDFIQDKLNGDIMQLVTFNFSELKNDKKYGNCGGFAFSAERTNIMKAIMTLTYSEVWPEISYYGFERYDYNVTMVNTYFMLLGSPVGNSFKGMQNFRPSADLLDRAWTFHSLCHTIGNYVTWAGGVGVCREQLCRAQRYVDTYLEAIHLAFTNVRKGNTDILSAINHKKKVYAPYRSDEGFTEMCKKMFLGDYLDRLGKPVRMFDGVWSDQKDLTREAYIKAVEQYFDFCEMEIPRRSRMIVNQLMEVLGMDSPIIELEKFITLEMPQDFEVLRSMPEDPDGAISYEKYTANAVCFIQTSPINTEEAMPLTDIKPIIDDLHQGLADNQGIVEVVNGDTKYNKQFVYSIIKSAREHQGMNYILTMHVVKKGKALCVRGQFEEMGTTGIRDTTVYEYARRQNLVKAIGGEGWFEDPYDEGFTRGLRMNLSEKREYDMSFPNHPLSQMRTFISFIIENN